MNPREFWQEIYSRFDPQEPVEAAQRVERPYSPADEILQALKRPFGDKHYLIYGTVGSGKSSELLWLAQQREDDDVVVFVDLQRHFSERLGDAGALQHIQPWEVLFLVGLSVYATGETLLGHRWSREEYQPLADATARFLTGEDGHTPTLDVAKLASTMATMASAPAAGLGGAAAGALMAVGAGLTAGKWNIPIGLPNRRPMRDQEDRSQRLLAAVNRLIAVLSETYRSLMLVVDGLDRITDPETACALFVESTLLGSLRCPTVLCGPISLRRSGLASRVRGFEMKPLVNIPVLNRADTFQDGPGIDVCWEVYQRRTQDIDPGSTRFTRARFRELARFSGGRLRDLILMVRLVAELGWDNKLAEATADVVDQAIDQRRRIVEQGLNRRHIELLQSVTADPIHRLPADDIVLELLSNFWLLPYPNESEWWYPHPLLTKSILPPIG